MACYITCYIAGPSPLLCLNVHLAGSPRDARVQKLRLLLYLPLLVLLPEPEHLTKGTWTGRTIPMMNRSLLLVVGAKLRTPWRRYWQPGRDP